MLPQKLRIYAQLTRLQGSLGAIADVQLAKDVVDVPLDCAFFNRDYID